MSYLKNKRSVNGAISAVTLIIMLPKVLFLKIGCGTFFECQKMSGYKCL